MNDWQTWTAGGVVAITLLLFVARLFRRKPGCGGDCGCGEDKTNR